MYKDIATYVRCCKTCALRKPGQHDNYGQLASRIAERPMKKLYLDFVVKLP